MQRLLPNYNTYQYILGHETQVPSYIDFVYDIDSSLYLYAISRGSFFTFPFMSFLFDLRWIRWSSRSVYFYCDVSTCQAYFPWVLEFLPRCEVGSHLVFAYYTQDVLTLYTVGNF